MHKLHLLLLPLLCTIMISCSVVKSSVQPQEETLRINITDPEETEAKPDDDLMETIIPTPGSTEAFDNEKRRAFAISQIEIIVKAVKDYKKDHGEYPDSLELIMPDYLTEIPTGVDGRNISYFKRENGYIFISTTFLTKPDKEFPQYYCFYESNSSSTPTCEIDFGIIP